MRVVVGCIFVFALVAGSSWLLMETAVLPAQLMRARVQASEAATSGPELVVKPSLGNSPLALDGPDTDAQEASCRDE